MVVAHAQLMPVPGRSNGSLPYPLLQEFESSDARNSVCACDEDVSRRTRAWRLELAARSHRGARRAGLDVRRWVVRPRVVVAPSSRFPTLPEMPVAWVPATPPAHNFGCPRCSNIIWATAVCAVRGPAKLEDLRENGRHRAVGPSCTAEAGRCEEDCEHRAASRHSLHRALTRLPASTTPRWRVRASGRTTWTVGHHDEGVAPCRR